MCGFPHHLFFHPASRFSYTFFRIYSNKCKKDRRSKPSIRWLLILLLPAPSITLGAPSVPSKWTSTLLCNRASSMLTCSQPFSQSMSYSLQSCVNQIYRFHFKIWEEYTESFPSQNSSALNAKWSFDSENRLPCIGGHLSV